MGLPIQPGHVDYGPDAENILCNAFQNLQRQIEYPGLQSIKVSIDDDTCGTDRNVRFAVGASAVSTTLSTLDDSDLQVEILNLLADTSQCSVACDVFEDLFGSASSSVLWSRLSKVSLSLAGHQRMEIDSQEDNASDESQSYSDSIPLSELRDNGTTAAKLNGSDVRFHFFGQFSFAKQSFVHETCVVKVPEGVKDEDIPSLAAMGCGYQTGILRSSRDTRRS